MSSNIFLLRSNNSLVKFESITYSGDCYLVSDINDNSKREWVMYYDLYKLIGKNENNYRWMYNSECDKIMRELLAKIE